MVQLTVYVDVKVLCFVLNCLNQGEVHEGLERQEVSLIQTKKHPLELQVPVQTIGQFTKKNKTTINLSTLKDMSV